MLEGFSFFAELFKMISALALVLGIMIGLAFLFRRFFQQTGLSISDGEAIHIISVKYLGPKSSIMIVDILGKVVVIGISHQQMSYITTIDDEESLLRLRSMNTPPRGGKGGKEGRPVSPVFNRLTGIIQQVVKRRDRA